MKFFAVVAAVASLMAIGISADDADSGSPASAAATSIYVLPSAIPSVEATTSPTAICACSSTTTA
ncbi:hypothetical protein PF005_g15156 [Phytophthora fragariae]|uniref:RxLR effector protein n=1 Tax=Phytophthora fragariae TaxID=53985 RepID=A0A6A3K8M4_9STRA|nr:hypothetical protein PF003_g29906 [Phytophthora fragariae]KAE8933101.1 hypothetical protein PF009_g16887 [Phytophthora fragariae]KAE9000494.1 hypothetical protein PF011_g14147 [Phytophthora fragariae]KAE9098060.1 hypothetical protein PF010_g15710 [Phytophthora fragariae]KAE9099013.1 hypothetical protein PF007_g16038 [Phytophthora fragariae]